MKEKDLRLFKSDFLNSLTRTHPYAPIIVAIPFMIAFLILSIRSNLSGLEIISLIAFGLLYWTLIEYVLHRYFFHFVSSSPFLEKIIYIAHGNHHDIPDDKYRSLMPPVPAFIYGVLIWLSLRTFLSVEQCYPTILGVIIGYQSYDYLHYSFHQKFYKNKIWRKLRNYHLAHHSNGDVKYGVSSPLWDLVLGTKEKK